MPTVINAAILFVLCVPPATAAHCSLTVKVVDLKGQEVEADIVVTERDGTSYESENQPGGVPFCGLGILPVDVRVGKAGCNQVLVRDVPLRWSETTLVKAIYDVERCLLHLPPTATCSVLIRSYLNGKPAPTATVQVKKPYSERIAVDEHGRAKLHLGFGGEIDIVVSAANSVAQETMISCSSSTPVIERKISLRELK